MHKSGKTRNVDNYRGKYLLPVVSKILKKILNERFISWAEENNVDDWCKAILCPLHKSDTTCNVDNYRGIYLIPVVSKMLTKILNERFISWAKENNDKENNDKEEQAGSRRNNSTIDQIFNLQSLVQKYMCKSKGRCYVLMVDFSKAFDTEPHVLLW